MNWKKQGLVWGCLGMLWAAAVPAQAQTGCIAGPDAAVQCFARNAVYTGLVSLPPGMTLAQYKAYSVAVSHIVQTPATLVFVLGTMGAVAEALPAIDADGVTPDPSAQYAAVDAIMDAAVKDGLIALPANTTPSQLKLFAHNVLDAMSQNNGVSVAPGTLLRFLDSYLINATLSDGTVDWNALQASLSSLIDGFVGGGLVKLPANVSSDNLKQFAFDVTAAINNYKVATGRASL